MTSITVVREETSLTVNAAPNALSLAAPGPQGPAGPQGATGPAGAAGGTVFEFTQSVPLATWVLNHNLGRKVHVSIFDDDGDLVFADVQHGTPDQTTITFSAPVTGSAVIS